jgi:FMN phosphatase YigB (HAD superfamily)
MISKIILTDCDGVLLDWETAFHTWMEDKGYTAADKTLYKMNEAYDIEKAESKRLIREFNESVRMLDLPAFRDARSGVARLVEAGYKFVVITSMSLDPMAKKAREINLEAVFGEGVIEGVKTLDTGADKDEALEFYRDSGLYWIEDKDENAIAGANVGLKSILIEHNHNVECNDSRVARCANWKEIADLILA